MKKAAILLVALPLGGCLSDSDTAANRSVLPPVAQTPQHERDGSPSDSPRQLCESTIEGNEPRTVCY